MSAVSAKDVTVGDVSFEIPNGYSINSSLENSSTLKLDNNTNYTIFISVGDLSDGDVSKNSREIAGFKFLAEENYTSDNNISINQQNFMKNESYFSFYSFGHDGSEYLIIYTFPVNDDVGSSENPVEVMINSIS